MARLEIHLLGAAGVTAFALENTEDANRITELIRISKGTATPMVSVSIGNGKTAYIDANHVQLMLLTA
ncbi:MAG TPA: hypothetical protein VGH54_23475 [Mycobacterium sp.]|jgi:hypothetical protein|uniref:hypothetical protein n=1 Tax=Mycobacterium sp. TaxID=1785 RepID=UPI002F40B73A